LCVQATWGVENAFGDCFSEHAYNAIPWLTKAGIQSGKLSSGTLVRYRAMVQDIFDPEYFDGVLNVMQADGTLKKVTSRYQDVFIPKGDAKVVAQGEHLMERVPYYCVSVPGESDWCRKTVAENDTMDVDEASKVKKRPVEDISSDVEQVPQSQENVSKKSNIRAEQEGKHVKKANHMENLKSATPIPKKGDLTCIVKLYQETDWKLNDMIEVVGILGVGSSSPPESSLESDFMSLEISARQPPASLVPRVHCISHKVNPTPTGLETLSQSQCEEIRPTAIRLLMDYLEGDRLAAEYVLLWISSGVLSRVDDVIVGKLSLALTRVGENSKLQLLELLHSILPAAQEIALNVSELCASSISPKKCYQSNKLQAGRLQTCNRTPIVVDETKLEEGKLDKQGIQNLQALVQVATKQTVTYDFQYYTKDWPVDLPMIVVSGNKSPLVSGTDCNIPLFPSVCKPRKDTLYNLPELRSYFHTIRNNTGREFAIGEDCINKIQADFVAARQRDSKNIHESDLHVWLNLARLWEQSHGSDSLSLQGWQAVQGLEKERRERATT